MEEKKKKKKKLTLSVSSKTAHNVTNYAQRSGKTSVVIEKKAPRRWGEKKFHSSENTLNKPKSAGAFFPKKPNPKHGYCKNQVKLTEKKPKTIPPNI